MTEELDPDNYNPKKLPLETLEVNVKINSVLTSVPALSHHFSERRSVTMYTPPPSKKASGQFLIGAKEEWLTRMECFIIDCQWLLDLTHHRFWSQIVFERSTWDAVISFVREAYPVYALELLPEDDEIKKTYLEICRLTFCLLARATHRIESKTEYIGKEKFAELLYNNFIITVPIMMDMCVIYGNGNRTTVEGIISYVFELIPKYVNDFKDCLTHVKQVFKSIEERLSIGIPAGETVRLNERPFYVKDDLPRTSLHDLLFYTLDICVTLHTFAEYYIPSASIMHTFRLEVTIGYFYENVIPRVEKNIQLVTTADDDASELRCKLRYIRYYILNLFHQCISSPLIKMIELSGSLSEDEIRSLSDSYLNVLTEVLGDSLFIADLNASYPVQQDLDIICQFYPEFQGIKYDYIIESLKTNDHARSEKLSTELGACYSDEPSTSNGLTRESTPKFTENETLGFIQEVKEIFPDLGDGYIYECLKYYEYQPSRVIMNLLESTLPESLTSMPMDLPYIPPEIEEGASGVPGDVTASITKDFGNKTRISDGKRKDNYHLSELVDDKSFVKDMKSFYSKLGYVVAEEEEDYDDEYDDTYDSVDVTLGDGQEEEEKKIILPRKSNYWKEEVAEEESDEKSGDERKNDFIPFAENPEVVRARYEARRQSKMQQRPQRPSRDVKGKPKGQGQEKDILTNRHKKDVHKSTVGNHNRRRMAQHKRQQGMMPS